MHRLALGVIAIVAIGACRGAQPPTTGLTLARVFGGAAGADRWRASEPRGVWLAPDGQRAILVGENTTALVASLSGAPIASIPVQTGSPPARSRSRRIASGSRSSTWLAGAWPSGPSRHPPSKRASRRA